MKIGVLGAGHLGKIHIKCIGLVPQLELVGFYDPVPEVAQSVSDEFGIKAFSSPEELMDSCEIIDIVTPTPSHFEMASLAIVKGKHVFIEKPVTETVDQAYELIKLKKAHGVKVQIGHVERFNPAYVALKDKEINPRFIEGHRLSTFNPRGTDVSVVLDLMIHDLDLVLQMVKSEVADIRASAVSVVSDKADICNARIEFKNGAVANLTASRISMKQMRKIRMFQPDAYVSLDLLEKEAQIIQLSESASDEDGKMEFPIETPKGQRFIQVSSPGIQPSNAIQSELESFHQAIVNDEDPPVTLEQGYTALDLAQKIIAISE